MRVYLSCDAKTEGVDSSVMGLLRSLKETVVTRYSDSREGVTSAIDQSHAVIAVIDDPPANDVVAEAAYAYGSGKPLLIVGTYEREIPRILKELPFAPLRRPSEMEETITEFLRDCRHRSVDLDSIPHSFAELCDLYKTAPHVFDQVDSSVFAELVETVFASRRLMPSRDDAGADYGFDFSVRGWHDAPRTLVQVKKRKRNVRLPIGSVQQFFGAVAAYQANYGILICPSGFSASADDFAHRLKNIELWDMEKLMRFAEQT